MSVVPIRRSGARCGTLLWIGDPAVPEFHPVYQHCLKHAPQLALRTSADEALQRPAAEVDRVVVARSHRRPIQTQPLELLCQRHREASWIDLLGPLCEGIRQSSQADTPRVPWHRWEQIVPQWLQAGSAETADSVKPIRSLAVVASSFHTAQALLDLAASVGISAVWCTTPDTLRIRNIDAVWWDDSLAGPTSAGNWKQRVAAFDSPGRATRHVWITQAPRRDQREAAVAGGMETVLSKPFRIDPLLGMLQAGRLIDGIRSQAA